MDTSADEAHLKRTQCIACGVFYGIISALSFALMSVLVKKVGDRLPSIELIFFRFATSFILLLPWILFNRTFSLKITQSFRYMIRILAALLALFLLFYSLKFIPLVDALLLNNTAPLFVPFIAYFLTKAKTPKKAWKGIFIGFLGVGFSF